MEWWHAIILGIVEGITEFLPISSTAHLTIAEKLLGYEINGIAITAFTAVIQIGAIAAAVLYFWSDISRVAMAWLRGLASKKAREQHDYKYGWAIIIGSIPVAVVGLLFSDVIETALRSLWWIAGALIVWSVVMWLADTKVVHKKREKDVTWKDTLLIGAVQCVALIPGVSRSGATISAGLFAGFDRVTATRFSFFLGIPALVAAGIYQAVKHAGNIGSGVGWAPTILAMVVSFGVAYVSIAWLLKYVSKNNFTGFIWYRVGLGVLLGVLLIGNVV